MLYRYLWWKASNPLAIIPLLFHDSLSYRVVRDDNKDVQALTWYEDQFLSIQIHLGGTEKLFWPWSSSSCQPHHCGPVSKKKKHHIKQLLHCNNWVSHCEDQHLWLSSFVSSIVSTIKQPFKMVLPCQQGLEYAVGG